MCVYIIFLTHKAPNLFLIHPSAWHAPIARFRRDQKRKPLLVNLCHNDIITPTIGILGAKINNDNTVDNTQKFPSQFVVCVLCILWLQTVCANCRGGFIASGLKDAARVDLNVIVSYSCIVSCVEILSIVRGGKYLVTIL